MKLLVQTTAAHFYMDPQTGCDISHNRPSVVTPSAFINTLAGSQKIKVLHNDLLDEATDAEFKKFVAESTEDGKVDMELAVTSFISKFSAVQEAQASLDLTQAKTAPTKPADKKA